MRVPTATWSSLPGSSSLRPKSSVAGEWTEMADRRRQDPSTGCCVTHTSLFTRTRLSTSSRRVGVTK